MTTALVEVELRGDHPDYAGHHTIYVTTEAGGTVAVVFQDGKAQVTPEVAKALKARHLT